MATVYGTMAQPWQEATTTIQQTAATQGWARAGGGPGVLVFKKGMTAFSWGSQLTVHLDGSSPAETKLMITTGESFAITDWGRGKRAARRLLAALGAQETT